MVELLCDRPDAKVYHARWQDLLTVVDRVDTLIVDAPYSERTHMAHDDGAQTANSAAAWAASAKAADQPAERKRYDAAHDRRALGYAFWSALDVSEFVAEWAPRTHGWLVSLTDHMLAPYWTDCLERAGRYVFSPLSCVEPGSRVRMVGDGPAQWSCMAVVSRPKRRPYSKWGSLPGAYVVPPGQNPRPTNGGKGVVGGKPLWLMERLVEDYSRPGDLVCDPCCGAGTTLTAALRTGRRAIGGDMKREHAEMAARACDGMVQKPLFEVA